MLAILRYICSYADKKEDILAQANATTYDVPELLMSGEDSLTYNRVMDEVPFYLA